jgi:hypothetical protein
MLGPKRTWSIWVVKSQFDPKRPTLTSDVTESLKDRLGDAVNDLVQPKTPMSKAA